ncbi:MAG: DNA ligase [Betaproteobacteria bacterium HGW-Betaproteobacteria-6]|jgi:DNA ligase-1|nr:MAG: DNA ligase [Betaproteobacteria bacterium HGW-Betaproteobacteria-6]
MALLLQALLIGLALTLPILAEAEAPAILLANVYREQVDVSRYLASEKLDGVRAVWDGQTLYFRSGKPINAPGWFLAGLPKQPLDGELWIARGQFERVSGIVRREIPDDAAWREVRYMIFELPGAPGPFSERAGQIRRVVRQAKVPWLFEIKQFFPVDRSNLKKRLDEVVRAGGEGLMLHLADAPYETGRSDVLLKVKPWQDAEAVVIGYLPGKGRFAGMLGALRVRTPEGQEFLLGTGFSDAQRRAPPAMGTTVTYRYRALTAKGLPRFASFLRIRDE